MREIASLKALIIGAAALLLASCTAAPLRPVGSMESYAPEEDEKRLWLRSEEEQERLDRSGFIYEDPALAAYLNEVASGLTPCEVAGKGLTFRIKVIKNPLLNAFAYPNGVIYVHTGILARMENEAELAALLGHEMTHATHRHAIQSVRDLKKKTAAYSVVQLVAMPFGIYGGLAELLGAVGMTAAVSGYSKELETQADRAGFEMMVNAGYAPGEAVKLFEHIEQELKEEGVREPFFFGTHPRVRERIDSYNKLIKNVNTPAHGKKGEERFLEATLPLLLENACLDLSMGRFNISVNMVDRFLQHRPQSPEGHYWRGEVYRQRGEEGDSERAVKEYILAANYDNSYAPPHRSLGLVYYKQGRRVEAEEEFENYLSLAPRAADRGYIEQYLREIRGAE